MVGTIRPVSLEEIKSKRGIWLANVDKGFAEYKNEILSGSEEDYQAFLAKALTLNGTANAYADFYFGNLLAEERDRVLASLDNHDRDILELFHLEKGAVYYPLNEIILPLLLKLSTREVLFSTFYFTRYPCTVWGNYSFQFPIFYQNEEIRKIYHGILGGGLKVQDY